MKRYGFTLIELLVVIAIIAILAASLFPVFAKTREKARQASCLSNAKQIALAIIVYAQDSDGAFPPASVVMGADGINWTDVVQSYVKNRQIFICPSFTATTLGYGLNPSLSLEVKPIFGSPIPQYKLDQIQAPSSTLMLADNAGTGSPFVAPGSLVNEAHNGGFNVGFMDGHAKWMTSMVYNDIYSPLWRLN